MTPFTVSNHSLGATLYLPEVHLRNADNEVPEYWIRASTVVRVRWSGLWLLHVSVLGFGLAVWVRRSPV